MRRKRISRRRRLLARAIKLNIGGLSVIAMFAVCCLDSPPPNDVTMCWVMVDSIAAIAILLQVLRLVERN
nr:MAG TPA: hypothetical protein [Caudoviricetes sp.]